MTMRVRVILQVIWTVAMLLWGGGAVIVFLNAQTQTPVATDLAHTSLTWDEPDASVLSYLCHFDNAPAFQCGGVGGGTFSVPLPLTLTDGPHVGVVEACKAGADGCQSTAFAFAVQAGNTPPPVCPGDPRCPPPSSFAPINLRLTVVGAGTGATNPARVATAAARPLEAAAPVPNATAGTITISCASPIKVCFIDRNDAPHCALAGNWQACK